MPGSCSATGGTFTCMGGIIATQTIDATGITGAVSVTDDDSGDGTSFTTTGTALDIDTGADVTTLNVDLDGAITATGTGADGINITHAGSDTATVTTDGEISATRHGIYAKAEGAGGVSIDANARVSGNLHGLRVVNTGSGGVDVTVDRVIGNKDDRNSKGVLIESTGAAGGDVNLTIGGEVFSRSAVRIINNGAGAATNVTLQAGGQRINSNSNSFAATGLDIVADADAGDVTVKAYGGARAAQEAILINHANTTADADVEVIVDAALLAIRNETLSLIHI